MTKRKVTYLGKNRVHADHIYSLVSEINSKIPSNGYGFGSCQNFRELIQFHTDAIARNQEISLIVIDNEYCVSDLPDPGNEEAICQDIAYTLKILERLVPQIPFLFYPAHTEKIHKTRPSGLEKTLLKDNLFLGTSEEKYFDWLASAKKSTAWNSNPLRAFVNARKEAKKDGGLMVVLLYQDAPLTLFQKPNYSSEFGIGGDYEFKPVRNFFEETRPDLIVFSEENKGRHPESLANLLRTYSQSEFNRGYFREALKVTRKARQKIKQREKTFREKLKILLEATGGRQKNFTPEEFEAMLNKAEIIGKEKGFVHKIKFPGSE